MVRGAGRRSGQCGQDKDTLRTPRQSGYHKRDGRTTFKLRPYNPVPVPNALRTRTTHLIYLRPIYRKLTHCYFRVFGVVNRLGDICDGFSPTSVQWQNTLESDFAQIAHILRPVDQPSPSATSLRSSPGNTMASLA